MSELPPVCDIVTVDYIRLATWDFQLYLELASAMRRKWVGWRKTRWLQYSMETHDNKISYGCATQNDKGHGVIQASGIEAHILFTWLCDKLTETQKSKLYGTRIDLQSTKATHPKQDYLAIHKRLKKPCELILGNEGNTLYIGNRESDSYWRLYDKAPGYARLETELKGKQAKIAWSYLSRNPDQLAEYYSARIQKSRVPALIAGYYQDCRVPTKDDDLIQPADVDLESKFLWLARLDSLVYKLANDHTLNERMEELISRWFDYVTKD